jgi:hypothetical protein
MYSAKDSPLESKTSATVIYKPSNNFSVTNSFKTTDLGIVVHACNLSTSEVKAGEW